MTDNDKRLEQVFADPQMEIDVSLAISICEEHGMKIELDPWTVRYKGKEGKYIVHLLTCINGVRQTSRADENDLVFRAKRIQREGGYFRADGTPFSKTRGGIN